MTNCVGGDPITVVETVVVNNSDVHLDYITYNYSLANQNDTIPITKGNEYRTKGGDESGYFVFPSGADSVRIIFNRNKQITYHYYSENDKRDRNPLFSDTYEKELVNDNYYRYTYIFTNEDYNNAELIE